MNQNDYIDLGLNGEAPLKVILRGSVETVTNDKVGVVSLVFASVATLLLPAPQDASTMARMMVVAITTKERL